MINKTELTQAYNKLKKDQSLYIERFSRYFHDDLAEKNLPDIRTFNKHEELLTNIWFIDKLLQTPLKKDTIELMDVETFNSPEIICSILENKRWEALSLLKLENKDAELFNLLGEISPIPSRVKEFRHSEFFINLRHSHPDLFEEVCLENIKNILYMNPEELTDDFIGKYLAKFNKTSMSLDVNQFVFNSKSPDWWLSNPNTLFLLLNQTKDLSATTQIPYDFSQLDSNNSNHKFLALLTVSFNRKFMHSFLEHFGSDLNTLQQAMGAVKSYSLTHTDLLRFIQFDNQKYYNVFNQDYENRLNKTINNFVYRKDSQLDVIDSVHPFLIVEEYLLKNNMHEHEIFDLSGDSNYLEIFKIFYKKLNNPHDETIVLDNHIDHLNRTLAVSEHPIDLLRFLTSATSSKKTFYDFFATTFNMSKVEINSLSPEDFYRVFETHFLQKDMYKDIQSMDKQSSLSTKIRKF